MRASLKHEGNDSTQTIGVEVQDAVIWEQFGTLGFPYLCITHAMLVTQTIIRRGMLEVPSYQEGKEDMYGNEQIEANEAS